MPGRKAGWGWFVDHGMSHRLRDLAPLFGVRGFIWGPSPGSLRAASTSGYFLRTLQVRGRGWMNSLACLGEEESVGRALRDGFVETACGELLDGAVGHGHVAEVFVGGAGPAEGDVRLKGEFQAAEWAIGEG